MTDYDLTTDAPFQAYANSWAESLTGKQVMSYKWPIRQSYNSLCLIKKSMMPALDQSMIQLLDTIPDLTSLEKGRRMLGKLDKEQRSSMLVLIPEFGAVDDDGYATLTRVNNFMSIMDTVDDLIKWLKDNKQHSKDTYKFRHQLAEFLPKRNPFTHVFLSFYGLNNNLPLTRIVQFRRDVWLADDHIDAILHTIEKKHYNDGGDTAKFFVLQQSFVQGFVEAVANPSIPLLRWDHCRLKQALDLQDFVDANPEREARVFTIVNTGGHWAVLVFDFKQKRLLFGDSMDRGKLDIEKQANIFAGARLLLESCHSHAPTSHDEDIATRNDLPMRRIRVDRWVNEPLRFPVPQQQDSSSCGLAALSSIEHSIHPSSELWSHERRAFFRVKYLMYATSTSREVCYFLLGYALLLTYHSQY
jgi:hypothetical protein